MSISQPSKEIYVVDIPETKAFTATFNYNFFVPDESVNETGGIPASLLNKQADQLDASFVQYSTTRVPRLVRFTWSQPNLVDIGGEYGEQLRRNNAFKTTGAQYGSLILDNIDKVISEDDFGSNQFVAVHFHDGSIDDKIYNVLSGAMTLQALGSEGSSNASSYSDAQQLVANLPSYMNAQLITQALTDPRLAHNTTFTTLDAGYPTLLDDLTNVGVNSQINVKLLHDLVNRTIKDPVAMSATDLVPMHSYSKQAKQAVNQSFSTAVSESDYKTFVNFIDVQKNKTSLHVQKYGVEIVGYIIDKFEVTPSGKVQSHAPIVIDSPFVTSTVDIRVKFNANYCYAIRTISLMTTPAIDDDTGEVATLKLLVSSRPSNKVNVSTLKLDNPPPPSDVDFVWDYGTSRLMVTWAFPVTSERDIKQFQVFRRGSVDECFELQKAYNFDDSMVPFPNAEAMNPSLVETLTSPATFWYDDGFDMTVNCSQDKGLIYSTCAIDAHGMSSNYSAQFLVWFDRFKNKLQKQLVSHVGAPKPYPNMYLQGDLFVNTINVHGPHSKRMRLYFNPQYYTLTDDAGNLTSVISTKQTHGNYKLQFMNMDNLQGAIVDITIDDQTQVEPTHQVQLGPKRLTQPGRATRMK